MIARPLMERLTAVRGEVALEVLRPPTLEKLEATLKAAAARGTPYHILHFDGHGTFGQGQDGASFGHTHFKVTERAAISPWRQSTAAWIWWQRTNSR